MQRMITEIVVHHSYSQRDQELSKSIASFNRTHKQRLYLPYNQPLSGVEESQYIAYHWVIAGNGDARQTRMDDRVGYHASNINANKRSIGICLTGNFDKEKPTEEQLKKLKEIVGRYKKTYNIDRIKGHRFYASKSCPGTNFTDVMIQSLMENKTYPAWATDLVRHIKRKGVTTDLHTPVGELPLYHLLAVIAKSDLDTFPKK